MIFICITTLPFPPHLFPTYLHSTHQLNYFMQPMKWAATQSLCLRALKKCYQNLFEVCKLLWVETIVSFNFAWLFSFPSMFISHLETLCHITSHHLLDPTEFPSINTSDITILLCLLGLSFLVIYLSLENLCCRKIIYIFI